jgi:hypothetical protein
VVSAVLENLREESFGPPGSPRCCRGQEDEDRLFGNSWGCCPRRAHDWASSALSARGAASGLSATTNRVVRSTTSPRSSSSCPSAQTKRDPFWRFLVRGSRVGRSPPSRRTDRGEWLGPPRTKTTPIVPCRHSGHPQAPQHRVAQHYPEKTISEPALQIGRRRLRLHATGTTARLVPFVASAPPGRHISRSKKGTPSLQPNQMAATAASSLRRSQTR